MLTGIYEKHDFILILLPFAGETVELFNSQIRPVVIKDCFLDL